jgi:uncharacterized protein (UPF0335 family)
MARWTKAQLKAIDAVIVERDKLDCQIGIARNRIYQAEQRIERLEVALRRWSDAEADVWHEADDPAAGLAYYQAVEALRLLIGAPPTQNQLTWANGR